MVGLIPIFTFIFFSYGGSYETSWRKPSILLFLHVYFYRRNTMADWIETALLCILAVIVAIGAVTLGVLTLLVQLICVCSPLIIIFGGFYWLLYC
jgi:hypothetical protein